MASLGTVRERGANSEGNRRERDRVERPQGPQETVPDPGGRESTPQAQTFYIKLRVPLESDSVWYTVQREIQKKPKRAGRKFVQSGGADLEQAFLQMWSSVVGHRVTRKPEFHEAVKLMKKARHDT